MKRPVSLWHWVGWRMGLIAAGAVVLMSLFMWLRFLWWEIETDSKIPPFARAQLEQLYANPDGHEAELWAYLSSYYQVDDVLPGITGQDWWTVGALLLTAIPIILMAGFMLIRPLSMRFMAIADAARKVAQGDLTVKLSEAEKMPLEVQRLTSDFNSMTQRLRLYEQEVQDSSAVVAHELRTPLNAAMGRVRGMLDEVFPSDQEQLELVLRQLENLNVLVDDLHLLSLAQAGQLKLNRTTFSLTGLLRERIDWFQPQLDAHDRNVMVTWEGIPPISADRNRVGQVINILLDNYLRYAASGGNLVVSSGMTPERLTLVFSDSGPGLTEEELQRVFQRFWRKEPSRTRRAGGSGLGLSVAQAICSAHGGKINVDSGKCGGLTVTVTLPS
ncbi:sensor histidine kinase [Pseudomonas monteilii]|uniref:sensor histidine kinase n=1 Tax=Pseudomonas monteilii TaxID=76759 RepID=UPI00383B77D5